VYVRVLESWILVDIYILTVD